MPGVNYTPPHEPQDHEVAPAQHPIQHPAPDKQEPPHHPAPHKQEPPQHPAPHKQEPPHHPTPPHKASPHHGNMSDDQNNALNIHNQGSLIFFPPFKYNSRFQNFLTFFASLWPFSQNRPEHTLPSRKPFPSSHLVRVLSGSLRRSATLVLEPASLSSRATKDR